MPTLPSAESREIDASTRTAWSLLLAGSGPVLVLSGIAWFAAGGSAGNYDAGTMVLVGLGACLIAPIGAVIARGKTRFFAAVLAALSVGLLALAYLLAA